MDLSKYAPYLNVMHDKTIWLFSKKKVPSDYIGDSLQWEPANSISCSIQPVTDKLTVETYGPRVDHMKQIHASPGAPISEGMGVALVGTDTEPSYTVITAQQHMTHTYILIEAVDVGSQD